MEGLPKHIRLGRAPGVFLLCFCQAKEKIVGW
jgi:hypothetical protein